MSQISGNEYPYGHYVIIIANPHVFSLHYINESREYFTFFRKTGAVIFDSREIIWGKLYGLK